MSTLQEIKDNSRGRLGPPPPAGPLSLPNTNPSSLSSHAPTQTRNSPVTRGLVEKSRQMNGLDVSGHLASLAGVAPIDTKAFFGKDFLKKFSNGLEGFARPKDANTSALLQDPLATNSIENKTPIKHVFKPVISSELANMPTKQNQHQHPPRAASSNSKPRPFLSVPPIAANENEPVQFEFKRPVSIRSAYTRSSTPAREPDVLDLDAHASVDYTVFQSLMVAQSKKEKLLKDKEYEMEQMMLEMKAENTSLATELERVKKETKAYIQNCDKLVRNVQQEAQAYQESAREAYQHLVEECRGNIPDLQSIKKELSEQIQNVEEQLQSEHEHRAKVGKELFHELENSKHAADFLRDKLIAATSDLADAKARIEELEQASLQENVALQHALQLLETSRDEVSTFKRDASTAHEDLRLLNEVEQELKKQTKQVEGRVVELESVVARKDEDVQERLREVDRLNVLVSERTAALADQKGLSARLAEEKEAKDKELAALQEQYSVILTKLDGMTLQASDNREIQSRLEATLLRAAALESQQTEHLVGCEKQKERLVQVEKDLRIMEDQYYQTKIRLDKALKEVESLDNRYEDYKAITRGTKQDLIDAQEKLTNAQEELKASHVNTEFRLEKHAQERKALQQLLELNANALGKLQEELSKVKNEKTQLELEVQNDPEKAQLKSQLVHLESQLSEERARLQASIVTLEKQVQTSTAVNKEMKSNLERLSVVVNEERVNKEKLLKDHYQTAQELKSLNSEHDKVLSLLQDARSSHDSLLGKHTQEVTRIQECLNKTESALAESQLTVEQTQLRLQLAEEQKAELVRLAETRQGDVQPENERWQSFNQKMQQLLSEVAETKTLMQTTAVLSEAVTKTKEVDEDQTMVADSTAELDSLREEVVILTERNSELEDLSFTLVERYKNGELTDQEANLVKQVVKSTLHVNQKDLVQKANELKRRDAMIQTLEKRIVDLEKQLASRLVRRSPAGQLMTMKDIVNSSPLDGTIQQVHFTSPPTVRPITLSVPESHDYPGSRNPTPTRVEIHSHHTQTFAVLNRTTSEEGHDDILQFSDKSPHGHAEGRPANGHKLRSAARTAGKRERYEDDDEEDDDDSVATRVARRRKLSASGNADKERAVGTRKGAASAGRAGARAGQGDGTLNAAAKYKAAQRGKMYR